ncbi:MAG: pyridoxamine 5'-phosphate oxidase [Deltaproteobacteria bacterium]|nr:pyridoxamine 5'-phosphate oxidase [Deltaproteobacteria bacterium]
MQPGNLSSIREDYGIDELREASAPADPLALFDDWLRAALEACGPDAIAMTLATAAADGLPNARTVLLKGVDGGHFVFFGNYHSAKGLELDANPKAALLFFWPARQRQVRVQGHVQRIAATDSDAYFATRPRDSQVGAWASPQSRVVADREELQARVDAEVARFGEGTVPRPPHWGGWRLAPVCLEFWQGRPIRLHDRLLYTREADGWARVRLAP